jgi:hypothetical protein
MAHNSTYVLHRPCGAPRARRRRGAPLRHMAHRTGWAQGHVSNVRFFICNRAGVPRTLVTLLPATSVRQLRRLILRLGNAACLLPLLDIFFVDGIYTLACHDLSRYDYIACQSIAIALYGD